MVWVLVPVLLLNLLVLVYGVTKTSNYRATARVLIGNSAAQQVVLGSDQNASLAARQIANEITYAQSDVVVAAAKDRIGELWPVRVVAGASGDQLEFVATAGSPAAAADVANAWAGAYVEAKRVDAAVSIDAAVAELTGQLRDLRVERQELRAPLDEMRAAAATEVDPDRRFLADQQIALLTEDLAAELNLLDVQQESIGGAVAELQLRGQLATTGSARVVNEALPPLTPANDTLARDIILGIVAGTILGLTLAFTRDTLDSSVSDLDELARLTGVPVLGTIPVVPKAMRVPGNELVTKDRPNTPYADAYTRVRASVDFFKLSQNLHSLLITSPNQGDGKTVVATNLGWAMTARNDNVIIADCDLRRPRVGRIFGLEHADGITDHLLDNVTVDDLINPVSIDERTLGIITAGDIPPNPADLILADAFVALIEKLRTTADPLILDGPPVLAVSDALQLGRMVDGVIVVLRWGSTSRQDLVAAMDELATVGANVIGTVVVGARARGANDYYEADPQKTRRRSIRRYSWMASARPSVTAKPLAAPTTTFTPSKVVEPQTTASMAVPSKVKSPKGEPSRDHDRGRG